MLRMSLVSKISFTLTMFGWLTLDRIET
eukprot:SAG11_NODE_22769_length_400_cov_1.192691_1_plen_27_part_10